MRIIERYEAVVKQTLSRVTVGEEQVDYEVTIQMLDAPGPYPTLAPCLVIILTMIGLQQDDRIGSWATMSSVTPSINEVDEAVQDRLSEMRERKILMARQIEYHATVGGN